MKEKIGNIIFCLAFIAIFIITIMTYLPSQHNTKEVSSQQVSVKIINLSEFENLIYNNKDSIILDVRDETEYNDGHIKNAINIPLEVLEQSLGQLGNSKDNPIILYCKMGKRSLKAASILASNGYTQVYVLKDGLAHYKGNLVE